MRARFFLALNVLALTAAGACSYFHDPDPSPEGEIEVSVLADGVRYAADTPMVPVNAEHVYVVAKVKASPGEWQLSLASEGAITLQGAVDGGVSNNVRTTGVETPADVLLEATIKPKSDATVRATLTTPSATPLTKSFRFAVQPVVPSIAVCRASPDGGCAPTINGAPDVGDDAGVEWMPLPSLPDDVLRDGDEVNLLVTTDPQPKPNSAWEGTLTTEGVLSLDGGSTSQAKAIKFAGQTSIIVPARIKSSGAGSVRVSIGDGPVASLLLQTDSASVVARRITFMEHVGLRARNGVILCSSRSSGSIAVTLPLDSGVATPDKTLLSVVLNGPCVDPYPGQAEFVWTGSHPLPIWAVRDEQSDASTFVAVPTLGTEVSGVFAEPTFSDAGSGSDGGACEGGACDAGQASVLVKGTLWRNAYNGGSEPLVGTKVKATPPSGLDVEALFPINANDKSTFTTDSLGNFWLKIIQKSDPAPKEVILLVDDQLMVPFQVIP